MERRATLEVEDVNPSWDARERHIIMEMESRLQLSESTWVGLVQLIKCVSPLSRSLRWMNADT